MIFKLSKLIAKLTMTATLVFTLMSPVAVNAKDKKITVKSSDIVEELMAINDARSFHGSGYWGYCLRFVADFWASHGATRSSAWSALSYGQEVCESHTMEGIPEGADVFFDNTLIHDTIAGHVGIYVGNGQFVSAIQGGVIVASFDDPRATVDGKTYTWGDIYYGWGYHKNVKLIDDISVFTVSDVEDQIYTGSAIKPEIVVKKDDKKLVEGKDYRLEYRNNVELGEATVEVIGINKHLYDGNATIKFNIVERNLSDSDFALEQGVYEYTGEAIEAKVVKRTRDRIKYEVTYENNIEPGIATVTITATEGCRGSITKTFAITTDWKHVLKDTLFKTPQPTATAE